MNDHLEEGAAKRPSVDRDTADVLKSMYGDARRRCWTSTWTFRTFCRGRWAIRTYGLARRGAYGSAASTVKETTMHKCDGDYATISRGWWICLVCGVPMQPVRRSAATRPVRELVPAIRATPA